MEEELVQKENNQNEAEKGKQDLFFALFVCLAIVIFVRSFLYEPFKIPSSSMFPTLKIGDHIFVSKYNYGLSLPFTKVQFFKWAEPQRGDVIVFLFPREESLYYVKRVIGVPGDKIEIKGKDIFINGEILSKQKVEDDDKWSSIIGTTEKNGEFFEEEINGKKHFALYRESGVSDLLRGVEEEIVPPNEYFVMGDNRDDSYDSRRWGYVPRENIKGKAQLVWLSLDKEKTGLFGGIRWNRLFTSVH